MSKSFIYTLIYSHNKVNNVYTVIKVMHITAIKSLEVRSKNIHPGNSYEYEINN